ncbi:hypothetical protein B0H17DRAFT_1337743 [Mycena rosella]|uniref:F-box domain-containing protein n=1 Tax=Mycena rosella TaxID=1033263 RepID=A0AAD7CQI4_MYCRO|nr:hypothetical protein B0H17DRAFT_1337743 [Mycena rosella]
MGTLRDLEGLSLTGDIHFARPGIPTFTDLLAMLRACPQLRDLTLDFLIPSLTLDVHHDAVELPFLTSMSLRASTLAPMPQKFSSPSASTFVRPPLLLRPPPHRLPSRTGEGRLFAFQYGRLPEHSSAQAHGSRYLSLNSHPTDGDALGEIMSAIFTAFPTTAITHLDARKGAGLTQHTWSTALRRWRLSTRYIFRLPTATLLFSTRWPTSTRPCGASDFASPCGSTKATRFSRCSRV